jgi:hypothetical protein
VVCGIRQENDELHETAVEAMGEWYHERMRDAHEVDDRDLTFACNIL